ncbi:flavodoxin family protein [Peribacillus cavernae]|uniref:Flavodoxin family protein n=1 Tax=Peribacillus cavernae TaxID=1674310 RepID=A0A3S0UCS9_9BACI|nr:flavodoxin family protein [Peribacillus cavernae]MDQ0219173.1 multimeric flavodoxin WrbA [Peribacillus cavernae]RUQ28601.1 flavodoxin family protein [Peribacillus cavernae]
MKLKALVLNCTLKNSRHTSNTRALIDEAVKIFDENGVVTEILTMADYTIGYGITAEAVDEKDEWPAIFEKVKEADILIIGSPVWLGEQSSIATLLIERLYGGSSLTNEKGQYIYYNKVGGVVVTGNEDGAKQVSRSVIYALSHIGFTIPPNVDTYWVGEAGPGPSFIEASGNKNEFTMQHAKIMAYNLIHFAKMLKEHPIPAEGNVIE